MRFSRRHPPTECYVYLYLLENGLPYYVGKGSGIRAWASHKRKDGTQLRPSDKKFIVVVAHKLSEFESYSLESKLTMVYGLFSEGGILVNSKHGGSGGMKCDDEFKKLLSAIHNTKETKEKHRLATAKSWEDEKIRNKRIESINSIETVKSKSKKVQLSWEDTAIRQKRIDSMLETTATKEYKIMRAARTGIKANRADKTIYEFVYRDGIEEKCTRIELCKKYDLGRHGVGKIVSVNKITYKGWKLKNV